MEVPFWQQAVEGVLARQRPGPEQMVPTVLRYLIDWQVVDLLEHTRERLRQQRVRGVEDVRAASGLLAGPGPEVRRLKTALEEFLRRRVYGHYRVVRMSMKGARIIRQLFEEFNRTPSQLPERYYRRTEQGPRERTVCDYLAGMTDRFAQEEFLRLFQPSTSV
jgi:dGTPase